MPSSLGSISPRSFEFLDRGGEKDVGALTLKMKALPSFETTGSVYKVTA